MFEGDGVTFSVYFFSLPSSSVLVCACMYHGNQECASVRLMAHLVPLLCCFAICFCAGLISSMKSYHFLKT